MHIKRSVAALSTLALLTSGLVACSSDDDADTSTTSNETTTSDASDATANEWPRTVEHELGETELTAQPTRIVSTSITLTGTLLAIGAPVTASAATNPSDLTDDQGFFSQWADIATDQGVDVLYPGLEFDMEALIAADPDLVVISTSGADSVKDHYEEISELFPTVAYDYSDSDWQDLAVELGDATGLEDEADAAITEFDDYVSDAAAKITPPEGEVNIVSYNGPGENQGIAKKAGAQSQLLEALGLNVAEAPEDLDASPQKRSDFAFVSFENLSQAITGDTIFLISATDAEVADFLGEPVLANLAAVESGQVYPLGLTSFRIDPYSGREVVDAVVTALT
ncbi:MAG: Fe2+-enterobactin ABC transporter substrate-binding protein [Corynebacterium sp.]|nr:Fe2+-enterobactin ABC transporter substrate-binding protein [Corynebacterium sp.]